MGAVAGHQQPDGVKATIKIMPVRRNSPMTQQKIKSCENGVKAVAGEATARRAGVDLLARFTDPAETPTSNSVPVLLGPHDADGSHRSSAAALGGVAVA